MEDKAGTTETYIKPNGTNGTGSIDVQLKSGGNSSRSESVKTMKTNVKSRNSFDLEGGANGNTVRQSNSKIIPLKEHTSDTDLKKSKIVTPYGTKLEYDDRMFITVNSTSRFIKVSNIECITAEKDYTYVCTSDSKKLLVLRPMVEWEERLPGKYFARIHRSTIVNLDYVEKVEKWFNYAYHVYIHGWDEPFQMSRRYASKLKERFR